MSSYIHFFIRKGDTFIPIGTYGRSTRVYEAFEHDAPWEQIRAVTAADLDRIRNTLISEEYYDTQLAELRRKMELIGTFTNTIEDKIDALDELEAEMEDWKDARKETRAARAFIGFLYDILDEADYGDATMDPAATIYVGMECGYNVTAESIMKN
jgi:hypothetical protein